MLNVTYSRIYQRQFPQLQTSYSTFQLHPLQKSVNRQTKSTNLIPTADSTKAHGSEPNAESNMFRGRRLEQILLEIERNRF